MTAECIARAGVQVGSIPDDLSEIDQWGLWKRVDGRKVPHQTNGRRASSTDPTHWTDFESAVHAYTLRPQYWDGLSFFFHVDDPFAGVDLDNCLDESGNPKKWAQPVLSRFGDTYSEISPSGLGVKIWCRGRLPAAAKMLVADGGVELYDRGRYFAVTGRIFRGAPRQVEDHANHLIALYDFIEHEICRTVAGHVIGGVLHLNGVEGALTAGWP